MSDGKNEEALRANNEVGKGPTTLADLNKLNRDFYKPTPLMGRRKDGSYADERFGRK